MAPTHPGYSAFPQWADFVVRLGLFDEFVGMPEINT